MPPRSILGHLRNPGDRDALQSWLLDQAPEVDGFVISLDMLVYGGLVPSRVVEDDSQDLLSRLELLRMLRRLVPKRPIFAFAATMRISNSAVAEEEKDYWAEYGPLLWAWSYHQDRAQQIADRQEAARSHAEFLHLETAIPAGIRQDYRHTRQRNLQVTLQALQAVREGIVDRLVLPQDDTAEFGLNVAERRVLQAQVQTLALQDRVPIYAGADEVMHTLCARMITELEARPALRISLLPSDPVGLSGLKARYEDRPVLDSIAAQIAAVGAVAVSHAAQADVVLALHTRGKEQGDWAMGIKLPEPTIISEHWIQTLQHLHKRNKPWALADLAYANGGDPEWLLHGVPVPDAYAGWNTASNTLGSVLSQCALGVGHLQEAPSRRALSLRLLEDMLYQAQVRQAVRETVDESVCTPLALLQTARALMVPASRSFAQAYGLSHCVSDLSLPWDRSFEVDLQLEAFA